MVTCEECESPMGLDSVFDKQVELERVGEFKGEEGTGGKEETRQEAKDYWDAMLKGEDLKWMLH